MTEWQLFEPGTIPEFTTSTWYAGRDRPPHIDEEAHRGRLDLAGSFVAQTVNGGGIDSVVDLGCGDGGLLSLLAGPTFTMAFDVSMWGYDLPHNGSSAAESRGVDVRYADVVHDDIEWGDMAVCTEMLEHLIDPHAFVRRIAEHSAWIVASSPFTETNQSHYGYHTWAWDQAGYYALVEQAGYDVVRHETWSMFQVVLGRKKES